MHFASDNWAGAHPAIADNVMRRNDGIFPSYGGSDLDRRVEALLAEIFQTELAVFPVATGTAANALALSAAARPGGIVLCHAEAHIRVDECGAPEFAAQGSRLEPLDGPLGRFGPDALAATIAHIAEGGLNAGRPQAVSVSQLTESGTAYDPDAIGAIASIARDHGLPVHMDGARFANAIAALGCTPAAASWQAGVDMLTFGGTKNGCWCAEAIIVFDPDLARDMAYLRKRSGHLVSKMRFISAQFEAYLDGGRWLDLATRANAMGAAVAAAIDEAEGFRLAWPAPANEVFAIAAAPLVDALRDQGVAFAQWQPPRAERGLLAPGERMIRLVASFATEAGEVDALRAALGRAHAAVTVK